jgi:hypothetical protein
MNLNTPKEPVVPLKLVGFLTGTSCLCVICVTCSYAAAHQPFILVPGVNHAQTSNGVPNYARGDIQPTTEYATATEHLSKAVASFVTSHQAATKPERQAAADELLVMVRRTAETLAPYFMASGGRSYLKV